MSEWKVQAKQHWANQRTPANLKEIPVKEWGVSVYYWPRLSLAEDRSIKVATGLVNTGEDGGMRIDQVAARVTELIVRARDEHGRLLFTESEFDDMLRSYDPDVVTRVVVQMDTEAAPTPEDASKN